MRAGTGKTLFLAAWSAVVALSAALLYYETRVQFGHGESIAELDEHQGVVQYRGREIPIWSYAASQQRFYENDVVATGDDAHAVVRFASGRTLALDANTQVLITTSHERNRTDYVVNLLSGSLRAAPRAQDRVRAPSALVVQVDDREIKVKSPQAVLAVSKMQASPTEVTVERGKAEVTDLSKLAKAELTPQTPPPPKLLLAVQTLPAVALPAVSVEPPPPPAPPAPAPKQVTKPAPPKRDLPTPKIVYPFAGARLWTTASLTQGGAPELRVLLNKSYGDDSVEAAAYVVRLANGTEETLAQSSDAGQEQQSVALKSPVFQRFTAPAAPGGLSLRRLTLQPGARLGAHLTIAAAAHPLLIGSLAEQPPVPVTVRVRTLAAAAPGGAWLGDSPSLAAGDAAMTLSLVSATDLGALGSLLAGAGQFSITAGGASGDGAYVVRQGVIVAAATLRNPSPEAWELLRKTLGADFVYTGRRAALVQGFQPTAAGRESVFLSSLQKDSVYVLRGRQLVGLESRLMRENPSARQLAQDSATAVFTEPVTIVSSR